MNRVALFMLLLLASGLAYCSFADRPEDSTPLDIYNSYDAQFAEAFDYCRQAEMDTSFMILIDMRLHSGRKRLFVYDFASEAIIDSGMVSHGCCDGDWGEDDSKDSPVFKNISESHCSSLGKYRVGDRGWSNWGIHVNYKLHGLEASNEKAYERYIVLHSWEMVSDEEVYPDGTPEGWGCPAVSDEMMRRLDTHLANKNDVLLWIIN